MSTKPTAPLPILFLIFELIFSNFLSSSFAFAQLDSTSKQQVQWKVSGLVDAFYVHDFNPNNQSTRQSFLYNHNRKQEANINLALLQFNLKHDKYRVNFALQTGTYPKDNYAAERGLLRNIHEATVGLEVSQAKNLWLDIGVMPSHIGFESAISSANMTLTRSLSAENSPYFLTGAKLTWSSHPKWELAGLILTGWQRIEPVKRNSLPSFGTQMSYRHSEKMTFNWSTFAGTDDPDATRRVRLFQNFYSQIQVSNKLKLIAGFDIGIQQKTKSSSEWAKWWSPVLIGQYEIKKNWRTALRAEYYQDRTGIIISSETLTGFRTSGISLNLDYTPDDLFLFRIEGRWMHSQDKVFESNGIPTAHNTIIAGSMSVRFWEILGN